MRTRQATTPPAPLVASGDADVKVGAGTMGTTATNAIETHYAGCRFRSRLVALQLVVGDRHDSYMPMGGKVEQAYLTARRARFEFGETPTPPAKPTRTTARPADAARAELAADRAEHATA